MYSGILTPEHLLRECTEHLVLAHSAIHRQTQARASVQHSVSGVPSGCALGLPPSNAGIFLYSPSLVNVQTQFSTVQFSKVQLSTVQFSTVQYSTVQYSTVQYSTVQFSTVQFSTVQYSVGADWLQLACSRSALPLAYRCALYSTVPCSAVQRSVLKCTVVECSAVMLCCKGQCSSAVQSSAVQCYAVLCYAVQ